ncbi:hypothetical protein ATANTOWER_014295 [Ataeniobius toweri]|uniref:Uncharacterized protein n=1 Tax=Ataeniobius toweri TaxID=208326 RepID=A0ABU7CB55_9TELE|nr:hypothetical protein [Ataeniobius toweri]
MSKMTIAHLGMVVLAICLSTQVVSEGSMNTTTSSNSTYNHTTMATETFSGSANSTSHPGAAVSLNAGGLSVLTPVIMAAFLLQQYC